MEEKKENGVGTSFMIGDDATQQQRAGKLINNTTHNTVPNSFIIITSKILSSLIIV